VRWPSWPCRLLTVVQILAILRERLDRLNAPAFATTPNQLRTARGPRMWSATEVPVHRRSCAEVWESAIEVIVTDQHPR